MPIICSFFFDQKRISNTNLIPNSWRNLHSLWADLGFIHNTYHAIIRGIISCLILWRSVDTSYRSTHSCNEVVFLEEFQAFGQPFGARLFTLGTWHVSLKGQREKELKEQERQRILQHGRCQRWMKKQTACQGNILWGWQPWKNLGRFFNEWCLYIHSMYIFWWVAVCTCCWRNSASISRSI